MPIIRSILDNDLYKFSMQKAVLAYRQRVPVAYVFVNRRPEGKFNSSFAKALTDELDAIRWLTLDKCQMGWLSENLPWLGDDYLEYLNNFRFDPADLQWKVEEGELHLTIEGSWERTILWEVPLMALISELFFRHCETDWVFDEAAQRSRLSEKRKTLQACQFSDFGTRRRRSFESQDLVVSELHQCPGFLGTSNVHLAHKYATNAIGTMAHEWIMGISEMEGLRHANRHALQIWQKVYQGRLGTALTDTFGTPAFFSDFDSSLARVFDGVRHDSGDPIAFADNVIDAYEKLGINPTSKRIIFSDGLNARQAAEIQSTLAGRINVSFGIGTSLTNDFPGSPALNMVIKLSRCNGSPVVKLSDVPTKAIGDRDALRVARWTFFGRGLDE
ncbi:MAG: nicotinate phosphoribosyltransferase [bacterium]